MRKTINAMLVFVAVVAVSLAIINNFYPFVKDDKNIMDELNNKSDISEQVLTTYVIPPKIAKALTTKEPSEFVKMEIPMAGVSRDFCTKAIVDGDGNLVLTLNKDQQQDWIDFSMRFINDAKASNVDISSDYTKMIVKWSASFDNSISSLLALGGCLTMQLLDGLEPETLQVEYMVVDNNSGEILLQAIWPYDRIDYGVKDGEFHINN